MIIILIVCTYIYIYIYVHIVKLLDSAPRFRSRDSPTVIVGLTHLLAEERPMSNRLDKKTTKSLRALEFMRIDRMDRGPDGHLTSGFGSQGSGSQDSSQGLGDPKAPYHINTYIHTYIHTYMHTYIHTYIV